MPENTIEAFLKACKLGVTTLEMDVVISADGQVVVSHEPFFNHEISTSYFATPITEENEKKFNIYQMLTSTIQRFDVGIKPHPRFPDQQKIKAHKPLLDEVVDAVKKAGYDPYYNIEIKRVKSQDEIFHPNGFSFTKRVIDKIEGLGIENKTTIQSFDHECLEYSHGLNPAIKTVILVEDDQPLTYHLKQISYTPYAYSPDFHLVTKELIADCHKRSIKVIPWTVNEKADIRKMIELGVDGIISDYPDRVIKIVR
jgi:glycerophosphoryl diester phosphodiesterase